MHESRKVFLLEGEREPRCILICYSPEEEDYTSQYKEVKTFDTDIQVGDYVAIPSQSRYNLAVVKVMEVDVEPDLSSKKSIDWVVGRIDDEDYEKTIEDEKVFIDSVRSAEKQALKSKLREDFLANVDTKGLKIIEHKT